MDKIPGSAGVAPGGGADGAFERFLTAAIATIITIMFSWRLLSEEEQAAMAQNSAPLQRASIGFQSSGDRNDLNSKRKQIPERPKNLQVNTGHIHINDSEITEKETTISFHSQAVKSPDLEATPPPRIADDNLISETTDDSLADGTLTTWDDYRWDEDDDSTDVVHTRRSVKDFINSSVSEDQNESGITEEAITSQVSSPSQSFTQRFANFEYRDSGGDSGYIDLYPDVESDDSTSDSEHEYDIQVSDSDSSEDDRGGGFYGVTPLDTIMEEEPYDFESDDSCDRHSKPAGHHEKTKYIETKSSEKLQTQYERKENYQNLSCDINIGKIQAKQSSVLESGNRAENVESCLSHDTVSKAGKVNAFHTERYLGESSIRKECDSVVSDTTLTGEHIAGEYATAKSGLPKEDINNSDSILIKHGQKGMNDTNTDQSPFILHLSKLQNKMKNFSQNSDMTEEAKTSEISDDSLPPSPIRTCALDNLGDEAFSDTESCSSESVITVLSVRSADSDQYRNIDLDDICDEPLNTSVITIMNNGQTPSGIVQSNQTSNIDSNSGVIKYGENITNIPENRDNQFILPSRNSSSTRHNFLHENGLNNNQINGALNTDSSETGNSAGSSSTDSLLSQENIHINTEIINLAVNGFGHTRLSEKNSESEPIGGISNRFKHNSSSSDSSDPPLREYDPEDDDLAELHFHPDSDDDSFYLIVGDEKNLRNFQTYQNLDSVGLSPEYGDARTSSTVNESVKGFTFSRTEEISTQFRKRTFVTDRACNTSDSDTRSDEPLSPITSEDEDSRSSENEHDSSEKVIVEFDLTKALHSDKNVTKSASPREKSSSDIVLNPIVDRNVCESETERKLDLNKYIIQSENSEEFEWNNDIDRGKIDGSQSISDDIGVKSGHNKNYIDPKSLETRTSSAKKINNSEYTSESFSDLLDKIESLGQKDEIDTTRLSEQELSYEKSHLFDVVEKDSSLSQHGKVETRCEAAKNLPLENEQDDTDVKNVDIVNISKLETNVDDFWTGDTASERPNYRETCVDDIFDSAQNETVSSVGLLKTTDADRTSTESARCRETNVDDLLEDDKIETCESVKATVLLKASVPNSRQNDKKVETNVDDIFDKNVSNVMLDGDVDLPSESSIAGGWSLKTETNVDDIIAESVYNQVSSPLESTPRETRKSVQTACQSVPNENVSLELVDRKSPLKTDLNYEVFADDLRRQNSQTVVSEVVDKSRSHGLCSSNKLICDNTQTDTCTVSSENTKTSSSLSVSDKEISRDLYTDKPRITESNDLIQYKGEASVTNDFENNYIGHSCQTIPQQLRQNPIYCLDVSNHSLQNNKTSNNESLNIAENYYIDNIEKRETIPTHGIVQLNQGSLNSVKRNSDDNNIDKKTSFGSHPTNVDYNANIHVPKFQDNNIDFGVKPSKLNYSGVNLDCKSDARRTQDSVSKDAISCDDIELKIVEREENEILKTEPADEHIDSRENLSSVDSSSLISDNGSLNSLEESFNCLKHAYGTNRQRGLSESAISRVVRTSVVVPSDLKKPRTLQGIKRKIHTNRLKQYTSILQQPITPEKVHVSVSTPEKQVPLSRLKISQSRKQFLSEENLSSSFDDKFLHYRNVLVTSTPRKYLKRHERQLMDMQSTESLPADMSAINRSHGNFSSMDMLSNYSGYHPRQVEELFPPGYDSRNSSYEHPDFDKLHKDCIFSPKKREEIRHTTESLENMFEQLLRYGSVSSLVETNLDSEEHTNSNVMHDNDISDYVSFQYPLERAASMSALTGSSDGHRLPRKPGKGRFASRQVPKSKSLQTLETNIDDVFEDEIGGELKKTPSVHELRVSKSLSKLNVPDWFKKSSFSRSGSTHSLFTYAGRQSSTSTIGSSIYPPSLTTSPSPSITPGSNAVIIQKRVTPTNTSSTAKLVRAPLLPTTPEKAPIHPTAAFSLPSDKFRKKDKKDLKPIAIVPFAKLREMFERGSSKSGKDKKSPVKSPVKENPPKVAFAPVSHSRETAIDEPAFEPVQNHTSASPPPPVPERKPILVERDRTWENVQQNHNHVENTHQRHVQVHFSDEEEQVSKSQEQNAKPVRNPVKPQSMRTSLPMPQFRFRRPTHVKPVSQPTVQSTQSKKGKGCYFHDNFVNAALHALQYRAKIDGEHLFEFLQRRRYSSLLENGFAEQMDDLQDKEVRFNFPVLAVGKHSISGTPRDGNEELQVILTNTCLNSVHNGGLNGVYRDASLENEIEGLLAMKEHRAAMLAMEGNRSIPRFNLSEDDPSSPESPSLIKEVSGTPDIYMDSNANFYEKNDLEADYILVTCENPTCKRETNLKEARKFFKTCHSCFTYYCSRSCRKEHWETHKKVCVYSRINSACKHVIKAVNRDPNMQYQCSRLARRGYLSRGRGCVIFAFPDISSTEDFLYYGMECLWVPPVYVCLKELPDATMLGTKLDLLTQTCLQYNPELKYVIHVAIVIPPKLPSRPVPRKRESIIQKCAKLRLSPAHMHPKPQDSPTDHPSTMILTAVPGNKHEYNQEGRKARELCFINIQRKLRQRGVSLRHHYPDVYNRLIDFVSDAKHFSPLIIYPMDSRMGKRFMCVIMPEAEPEIEWIRDPDLFQELDIFDEEDLDLVSIASADLPPVDISDTFV